MQIVIDKWCDDGVKVSDSGITEQLTSEGLRAAESTISVWRADTLKILAYLEDTGRLIKK